MRNFPVIAEWRIVELERDYYPLNVRQEILKLNHWLEANPRVQSKSYHRRLINWLNKGHAWIQVAEVNAKHHYRDALVGSHSRTPSKEQLEQYERNAREGYWP